MASIRKKAITALKIVISAVLIYFIYTKIDLNEVFDVVKKTNLVYLMLALLLFVVSKIIAALRLNLYFHQLEVSLTQKSNLKLYLLGMFYNLFLPGGIGGDAYKGYLIKKKFGIASKKIVSILVLDRLSGLVLLFIYACVLALFMHNELIDGFKNIFLLGIVVGICGNGGIYGGDRREAGLAAAAAAGAAAGGFEGDPPPTAFVPAAFFTAWEEKRGCCRTACASIPVQQKFSDPV